MTESKNEFDEAKESRIARERERLLWEEEERQRKMQEREAAERLRQEAEIRALYAELDQVDYDLLALLDYPTDHELYSAKRARTLWFIALGSALFLFLASLFSLTSPWVGGIAGGIAFVLWLTHGANMMAYFPSLNRYNQLVVQRKQLKHHLIEYIRHLEGHKGFIHRIYPLVHYNARLGAPRFKRLALMSREHTLLSHLRTLQDARVYHEFMVEAQRGYKEFLQKEKEDAFIQSMDFDPDLLAQQAAVEEEETLQEQQQEQEQEQQNHEQQGASADQETSDHPKAVIKTVQQILEQTAQAAEQQAAEHKKARE